MCDFNSFRTGDLCISKTLGKFASLIRGITISDYNHVCVAIRIDPLFLPQLKIIRTGGVLLFLEKSKNPENGEIQRVIRVNTMLNMKVLRLPLKDQNYTKEFEQRITELLYLTAFQVEVRVKEYTKIQQPENFIPTINIINRITPIPKIHNVCSENTAELYLNTLPDAIDKNVVPVVIFVPQTFLGSAGNPYYDLFDDREIIYDTTPTNDYWWELIIVLIILMGLIFYSVKYIYRRFHR